MSKSAFTIWFTGLPASGKSTLAYAVADRILARGLSAEVIDSGKLRKTPLGASLGFSRGDRDLNVRRHGLAARLLARNGVVALVAAVSPYRATRNEIRAELKDFVEVHVATPPEVCAEWDNGGLWRKALAGELQGFTGVDDPYEAPDNPEARVDLSALSIDTAVEQIMDAIEAAGWLDSAADATEEEELRAHLGTLDYR